MFSVAPNNNIHDLTTTHNDIVIHSGMRFQARVV